MCPLKLPVFKTPVKSVESIVYAPRVVGEPPPLGVILIVSVSPAA